MSRTDKSPERTPERTSETNDAISQFQRDILLAEQLGMSVYEMYEMFEEVNRQIEEEQEEYEEWPNLSGRGGYEDEGREESYAG